MTTPPQDPQYPDHPPVPQVPGTNPRPIRASRVWAGIGMAIGGYIVVSLLSGVLLYALGDNAPGQITNVAIFLGPLALLAAVIVGIVQIVRGDRGIGVGLLIGAAGVPIVVAGACVVLIIALAPPGTFG